MADQRETGLTLVALLSVGTVLALRYRRARSAIAVAPSSIARSNPS